MFPRIMKTNTRLYSVLNCTVHVSVCWRFGLSTFWSVDVLVCRCFGMSMFWFVDALVCRRFGLSMFRCVGVLTSYLQKDPLQHIKAWLQIWSSFCRWQIQMDFLNFYNLALDEFYFLNMIYILVYIDLILSTFFQHSNILTRASHHWCLASNIVLVVLLIWWCKASKMTLVS